MLLVVSEKFLWSQNGQPWRDFFASRGLHLTAAISVAEGLTPRDRVPTLLCIFGRHPESRLFVGRLTPTTDTSTLLANLLERRGAQFPELGALVDPDAFTGWANFSARADLDRLLEQSSVPFVPLGDLSSDVLTASVSPGDESQTGANSLYFDARVVRAVTVVPPTPSEGATSKLRYHELVVNPDLANAAFLAAWLNGPNGRLMLRSHAVGTAQKRIQRERISKVLVPLPPLDVQSAALLLGTRLSDLKQELNDLESRLLKQPWAAADVERDLAEMMEKDPLDAWINRLPFPLASIAARYRADADPAQKVERLLHLFEAFAEFITVLLLTALRRRPEWWERELQVLRKHSPTGRALPAQATFGNWLFIGQRLAKTFRKEISDQKVEPDHLRTLFGIGDPGLIDALTGKDLWKTLHEARSIRNERGHGGASSTADQERRLERLEQLLVELRDGTRRAFARVELIQPGASQRTGGVRHYRRARCLTGPLTIFSEREIAAQANVDLDGDALCLVDVAPIIDDALELIPLVRLEPSPDTEDNAAYFFNQQVNGELRFVSYHFPNQFTTQLTEPGFAAINDLLE